MTKAALWYELLRALREAAGLTQDGWAARLGYGRRTVQRWEQGAAVPDAAAEQAILAFCAEAGLFSRLAQHHVLQGEATAATLQASLAAARLAPPVAAPPAPAPAVPATNLPAPLSRLIGRARELATVRALLQTTRLLTLVGPAGVGKSRLALELGHQLLEQYADGVFLVPLAAVPEAALVAQAIARSLAIPEPGDQLLVDSLRIALAPKEILLILDNFEHVLGAAPVVAELLERCERLQILVTSRSALHVSGEREYSLPPLPAPELPPMPVPDAVARSEGLALFVARARDVQPDLALDAESVPVLSAICRRLDGLPLAIELAAARSKVLPPSALLALLAHPLPLLTGGPRNLPRHQQTLRDTIAWSYALLTPIEQALFRRLAAFAGGCILEAAAWVCGTEAGDGITALDGIASLVDKSLLIPSVEAAEEPRFGMLATIHEFAAEQLRASGEERIVRRRHASYYVHLAEEAERGLRSPQGVAWMARLSRERENLRAAVAWAVAQQEGELALGLVGGLELWFYFVAPSDGREWTAAAL
ncbi:MAG TPA: AAA family ATPase, partial [Dehalococcoidia bacterium]|nr:AAA family ATPase [Dehalococcoidia bacterium]